LEKRKISFDLPLQDYEKLKETAAKRGLRLGDVLREAVDHVLRNEQDPPLVVYTIVNGELEPKVIRVGEWEIEKKETLSASEREILEDLRLAEVGKIRRGEEEFTYYSRFPLPKKPRKKFEI